MEELCKSLQPHRIKMVVEDNESKQTLTVCWFKIWKIPVHSKNRANDDGQDRLSCQLQVSRLFFKCNTAVWQFSCQHNFLPKSRQFITLFIEVYYIGFSWRKCDNFYILGDVEKASSYEKFPIFPTLLFLFSANFNVE